MRALFAIVGLLVLGSARVDAADVSAGYTQGPGGYYKTDDRSGPYSISPDGAVSLMGGALPMPFMRGGDPIFLAATTTPTQYEVAQPAGTKSYRGVNPCSVDVRLKTVSSMGASVTSTTGTRFLARTAETLSSVPSLTGPTRIISIVALADPGAAGCVFEIQYGNGG